MNYQERCEQRAKIREERVRRKTRDIEATGLADDDATVITVAKVAEPSDVVSEDDAPPTPVLGSSDSN